MMTRVKFASHLPLAEKMSRPATPQVKPAPSKWIELYGGSHMLIPTPRLVEEVVNTIPKGKLMTVSKLRRIMAEKYEADFSCPLTTGIFLRVLSEYIEDQRYKNMKTLSPYWRVIRDDGSLIDKFKGGIEHQASLLSREGFSIIAEARHKLGIKDYRNYLVK